MLSAKVALFGRFVQQRRLFHFTFPIMTNALVILSEGAEEMETVISIDVLRRAGVRFLYLMSCFPLLQKGNNS